MEHDQESTEDVEETKLDIMLDEIAKVKHLLKLILKERHSDTLELIEDIVKKTPGKSIAVNTIEHQIRKSRSWTIRMMKKVALLNPNIKFIRGDKASSTPSRVVWTGKSNLQQYQKLLNELVKKEAEGKKQKLSMGEIMSLFQINNKECVMLVNGFRNLYKEYELLENEHYDNPKAKWEDNLFLQKIPAPLT